MNIIEYWNNILTTIVYRSLTTNYMYLHINIILLQKEMHIFLSVVSTELVMSV